MPCATACALQSKPAGCPKTCTLEQCLPTQHGMACSLRCQPKRCGQPRCDSVWEGIDRNVHAQKAQRTDTRSSDSVSKPESTENDHKKDKKEVLRVNMEEIRRLKEQCDVILEEMSEGHGHRGSNGMHRIDRNRQKEWQPQRQRVATVEEEETVDIMDSVDSVDLFDRDEGTTSIVPDPPTPSVVTDPAEHEIDDDEESYEPEQSETENHSKEEVDDARQVLVEIKEMVERINSERPRRRGPKLLGWEEQDGKWACCVIQ